MANRLFNFSTCINVPQSAAANKYGIRWKKLHPTQSMSVCARLGCKFAKRSALCRSRIKAKKMRLRQIRERLNRARKRVSVFLGSKQHVLHVFLHC